MTGPRMLTPAYLPVQDPLREPAQITAQQHHPHQNDLHTHHRLQEAVPPAAPSHRAVLNPRAPDREEQQSQKAEPTSPEPGDEPGSDPPQTVQPSRRTGGPAGEDGAQAQRIAL